MISSFILGALVGFLLGLAVCYGKQIMTVYQNRGKIEAAGNAVDAASNLASAFGLKL